MRHSLARAASISSIRLTAPGRDRGTESLALSSDLSRSKVVAEDSPSPDTLTRLGVWLRVLNLVHFPDTSG